MCKLRETDLGDMLVKAVRTHRTFQLWLIDRVQQKLIPWKTELLKLKTTRSDCGEPCLDARRTDIWIEFAEAEDQLCSHLLFAELKIAAPFDVGQAEDYKTRARNSCNSTASDRSFCRHPATMLIAPQRYLDSHSNDAAFFDVLVALEEVKTFFGVPPTDASLAIEDCYHECYLTIGRALEDAKAGYIPLGDDMRREQFRFYRLFVEEYQPHLRVHERDGTKQAYDIQLDLPIDGFGYIKHRIFHGSVVIELSRRAKHYNAFKDFVSRIGGGRYVVEYPPQARANPSNLYIRDTQVRVPHLSKIRSFAEQEESLKVGIDAADALFCWVQNNASEISSFVGAL